MTIHIPPGVFDILPRDEQDPWKSSYLWNYIETVIRNTAREFGFEEIRTPVFERTELFQRGVGETSDIVSKEMYTFDDKGGRSMSLRPEGTAPVMRSFIENKLYAQSATHRFFYIEPMFRYERAQAGRYRQHHQFGVESIGNNSPEQDAEVIDLLYTLYTRLGLKNLKVSLNSIGDISCRLAFRQALQDFLRPHLTSLSVDSQARFENNPLRILDSKDLQDQAIIKTAPSILDFLSENCRLHFEAVKKALNLLKIPFEINTKLVRGLDYYNKTVFEIVAEELGSQNSIGGGGRYDGLLKSLGGPDLPAVGFGTGIERILQTMIKQQVHLPEPDRPILFIIPIGDQAKEVGFTLLHDLRQKGVSAQMDFSGRKLNKMMQYANQISAKFVAVIGEDELASQILDLKEMSSGTSRKVSTSHLAKILEFENKSEHFMHMLNDVIRPFETSIEADYFKQKIADSIQTNQGIAKDLQTAVEKIKNFLEE